MYVVTVNGKQKLVKKDGTDVLTSGSIEVYVEGNKVEKVKKELVVLEGETTENVNSKGIPLYETREGKQVQYGVKYHIKLTNFELEEIEKGEKYLKHSGRTEIVIGEGTLVDNSGNRRKIVR